MSDIESWAEAYIEALSISDKLAPPARPDTFSHVPRAPQRIANPGRDPNLTIETQKSKKAKTKGALSDPKRRAELVHRFLHHEVQAAELMAWALLAFPDTPAAFKRGLMGILDDEVRHACAYESYLQTLGYAYGSFPVRDWFWQRVPQATCAAEFVATMGMGFEGGNLDHTTRFAEQFSAAGDERGAAMVARVGVEEVSHVKFAMHWFEAFTGREPDFDGWRKALPSPLSPVLMKGPALDRALRTRAGFSADFLDALSAWTMDS